MKPLAKWLLGLEQLLQDKGLHQRSYLTRDGHWIKQNNW